MDYDYWLKQTKSTPLFPELEWSRPENKLHAGKLLIVGGSVHGFAAPAEAYGESIQAGVGAARALLPQSIQKIVGIIIDNADFAPATPSGSFSQKAIAELLDASMWASGVLFAGDLGRNSETAIVIERFLQKTTVATTLTKDAVDYCISAPHAVLDRENTLLVLSLSQLQRLGTTSRMTTPIAFNMDLLRLVGWLHEYTTRFSPYIIVKHADNIVVAVDGRVSSTKLTKEQPVWRVHTAAHASVWWLQNPDKPFESISTSIL